MKTGTIPYRRLGNMAENYWKIRLNRILRDLTDISQFLIYAISFFLGRTRLIGGLMPFGTAFYASTMGFETNRLIVGACIILGMITQGAGTNIYKTLASMLLFNAFNIPLVKLKKNARIKYAATASAAALIPELLFVHLQGFLLYDLILALFNTLVVFTTVIIFRNAVTYISGRKNAAISNEEMISLTILVAVALTGLWKVKIAAFSLGNIAFVLLTSAVGYACGAGAGAAAGVTSGLIVNMTGTYSPLLIGGYALCGLLAGVFRSLGKIGTALGFIIGSIILTLYMDSSGNIMPYMRDMVMAIGLFAVTPRKLIDKTVDIFGRDPDIFPEKTAYSQRIKELTVDKLQRFSHAFRELARTFSEISETTITADKQDISVLFDRVADKVCKDCTLNIHCWDRNFYNTYQVVFKIVEKLDSKGRISEEDIPGYFLERCERIYDFVQEVSNMYQILKVDMVWKSRITESRELVSRQMEGLSRVISNLAGEIDFDVDFKSDLEHQVKTALEAEGVKVSEVIVFVNKWGKYEASVVHRGCGGSRKCLSVIEKTLSSVLGKKMTKRDTRCVMSRRNGKCTVRFVEEEEFRVTTGIARVTKHNSNISGDSYTFMNTGDGRYIIALSDGMGSGYNAARQSQATVSLIEQLMESGFDKDTTIKLINSILVLKSSDDSYTTIDLAVVDLYSGETEFVKVGAAPTFIKRGDIVETVKMATLPAGILNSIETELERKVLGSGDFVIMVTDGVVDAFDNAEDGETLREFLQSIDSINPQTVADSIINKALEKYGGKALDDMIVIAAKVWKRVD